FALLQERGEASPAQMAKALRMTTESVAYHVRTLVDHGVIALSRTVPVRGAIAHFYEIAAANDHAPDRAAEPVAVSAEGSTDDLSSIFIDLVEAATDIHEGRIRLTCV